MGKSEKADVDIFPSIMCVKPWEYKPYIGAFEQVGIPAIHFDVMDGHYVPNVMLGTDDFNAIREATEIPIDLHIMATEPDGFVSYFDLREGDRCSFHPEVALQPYRMLDNLRKRGIKAGLALSPGVPVSYLEECLSVTDFVMVMAVSPGFAGQTMVPDHLDKLRRLADIACRADHPIELVIDGHTIPENARKMLAAGATGLVVGTSTLLRGGAENFAQNYRTYQEAIRA